jgi:hypothetical protein
MRHSKVWRYGFVAAIVLGIGCGGTSSKPDAGDAGSDVRADGKPDVKLDATPDATPDLAADLAPDTAADAGTDVAPDATSDAADGGDAGDATAEVDPACATIPVNATRTVHLRITADNECDVFVNGQLAGSTTNWGSPVTLDVSLFLHPGRVNVIGVVARNTSSQGGPDRGIIGQLDDLADAGAKVVIVTDDTWKTSKVEASGWPALLFDDSAWANATVVGAHGDAPWGALLGTSTAKWLWSAPIPASTNDKPNLETAYFRKTFYFGTDGTTLASKPACPAIAP